MKQIYKRYEELNEYFRGKDITTEIKHSIDAFHRRMASRTDERISELGARKREII